jgi:hypothetical protein
LMGQDGDQKVQSQARDPLYSEFGEKIIARGTGATEDLVTTLPGVAERVRYGSGDLAS